MIIYTINYGLSVFGLDVAMDFGMLGEWAVHGQPIAHLGTLKIVLVCLVGPKLVHVCFKQNIARIGWLELCEKKEIVNAYN